MDVLGGSEDPDELLTILGHLVMETLSIARLNVALYLYAAGSGLLMDACLHAGDVDLSVAAWTH